MLKSTSRALMKSSRPPSLRKTLHVAGDSSGKKKVLKNFFEKTARK